jgi:phosphoribosylformylglycinamidine cyclo-ligase
VEERLLLDGSQIQRGDVAIALASSGVHSNGFSLVRKIVSDRNFSWSDRPSGLGGLSLGEVFLTPTQIYVKPVLAALKAGLEIHGMAHITGGGLPENLPRCLSAGQAIELDPSRWSVPPVFQWLAEAGDVSPDAMYNTFNMGVGFVAIVPSQKVEVAIACFAEHDIAASAIGQVVVGEQNLLGL